MHRLPLLPRGRAARGVEGPGAGQVGRAARRLRHVPRALHARNKGGPPRGLVADVRGAQRRAGACPPNASKLSQVVHLCAWHEWFDAAQSGSARDAVRSVQVAQPHAGAPYSALPAYSPIPSRDMLIMLQRRLGLPISELRNKVGTPFRRRVVHDAHGDAAIAISAEHNHRHNAVLRCWATAFRAASRGSRVAVEDNRYHTYSPHARPDITVFDAGGGGLHLLLDVKVKSTLTSAGAPRSPAERGVAFGGVARATRDQVDAKYGGAIANGHTVEPLLHCTFGGMESAAAARLQLLHDSVRGQLADPERAPWTARSFLQLHAQRISTAVQLEAARQVRAAATGGWSAPA